MSSIEMLLRSGGDPFSAHSEDEVLHEAGVLLAKDYRNELIDRIDERLDTLVQRESWINLLLDHVLQSEGGTNRAAAARALVRHFKLVAHGARGRLVDALARGVEDQDAFFASQSAFLGVVAARAERSLWHRVAAALVARSPANTPDAALAERLVAATGLLEAAFPDQDLVSALHGWLEHADPHTQGEAAFQLGRAELRHAPDDYPKFWPRLRRARDFFRSATESLRRADAAMYAKATELLASSETGLPDSQVADAAVRDLRALAAERWALGESGEVWRIWEEHFLVRGVEQLASAANALRDIDVTLNAAQPLLALAQAADASSREAAELGVEPWVANEVAGGAVRLATAATLQIRLPLARAKLEAELAHTSDPVQREYLARLRDALADDIPKAQGDGPRGASPLSGPAAAAHVSLDTNTGWPQADALLRGLIEEMKQRGLPEESAATDLLFAATEIVVGFVADRTDSPRENLRFANPNYWRAKPDGPGKDALEEDVRADLYMHAKVHGFDYLLSKEEPQMGGRADIRLSNGGATLVIETKREKDDVSRAGIHVYVAQAQSYVGIGNRWSVLLVLDLTEKAGRPDTFHSRFWVDHIDPGIGTDDRPEHVLVAVVSGNRLPPSHR